jgi:hypothetical protein
VSLTLRSREKDEIRANIEKGSKRDRKMETFKLDRMRLPGAEALEAKPRESA